MSFFFAPKPEDKNPVAERVDSKVSDGTAKSSDLSVGKAFALVSMVPRTKGRTKGRTSPLVVKSRGRKMVNKDGQLFNSVGRPPIIRVPGNNTVHKIVQMYEVPGWITASNTVPVYQVANVVATSIDQISSLTALFDQYRIARVEFWVTPRNSQGSTTASANVGLFHSVIDFDDSTQLASVAAANDYTNVLIGTGLDGHYRTFVPHAAVAAYSGTFTSYANVEAPWIDAASTSVQHYGMKCAWTVCDAAYVMDLVVRVHSEWRNIR